MAAHRRMLHACRVQVQNVPAERDEAGLVRRITCDLEVAGKTLGDVDEAIAAWANSENLKVLKKDETTALHKASRREPPGFVRVLEETIVWA